MVAITVEYMIMIPILILQIFLLPLTAAWAMDMWIDSSRTLALGETASHLGSSVQQICLSLSHQSISEGVVINKPSVPPFIEGYSYTANATLRTVLDPALNSSKVLEITLRLGTVGTTVSTSVILGQNVAWIDSTFASNSTNACIRAEKFANQTVSLSFGG